MPRSRNSISKGLQKKEKLMIRKMKGKEKICKT